MSRWTSRLPFLVVLCMLGCEQAPEDPLFTFGSVETPDGKPFVGTVQVLRQDCEGIQCAPPIPGQPDPSNVFVPFTELQSDEDGSWMLEVTRFDASIYTRMGTLPRSFRIVAQPDASLPPVQANYMYLGSDADLPPLRQWGPDAEIALAPGGDALTLRTTAPPPIPKQELTRINEPDPVVTIREGRYGIAFLSADGQEIWFEPVKGGTRELPLTVLEDFAATWQPIAEHRGYWAAPTLMGGSTFSDVFQHFPAASLPDFAPRIPPSRGAGCSLHNFDMSLAAELTPCPLTDGLLETHLFELAASVLQVTLDTPATLEHLTVRGLLMGYARTLVVEAFDGTDWQPVARIDQSEETTIGPGGGDFTFTVAVPPQVGPVHAVRFSGEDPHEAPPEGQFFPAGSLYGAQEVSLF